jgi:hypothetical protein
MVIAYTKLRAGAAILGILFSILAVVIAVILLTIVKLDPRTSVFSGFFIAFLIFLYLIFFDKKGKFYYKKI